MSTLGDHLDELPDEPFDVICQVGGRSGRVVEALAARGYDATNVDGGTGEWVARGYPDRALRRMPRPGVRMAA